MSCVPRGKDTRGRDKQTQAGQMFEEFKDGQQIAATSEERCKQKKKKIKVLESIAKLLTLILAEIRGEQTCGRPLS